MADLRCSVCGLLTLESEPGAHTSGPEPAECALTSGVVKHIVCGSCSNKLSQEIAKGRTSILHPIAPNLEGSDASAFDELNKSAEVASDSPSPTPISGDTPSRSTPADSVEFEFARKRHFAGYELLGEISRGSFGVVYKARQAGLDRVVALKVLLDGVHASQEAIERFNREAKSVARLKHPNVVPIYDIGACDGHHYFAMEFIEGFPLSTHILARSLTISDSLSIAECIADAIECAHRAGVIHRDIKPSNILVDKNGVPHITDFGLAKQVDLENKYTMSGTTLGTPAYMPPEQARGQINKIDARSDVYALGTVLYEMLTGVTPFSGRSLLEVVVAVINEPVVPPRQLNPKIHRDIQTIVLKCLEKERAQRYTTAADLRDDLRRFRSGEAILARPAGVFSRAGRYIKRQKWFIAAAAAVLIAFGLTMLLLADNQKQHKNIEIEREKLTKKVEELNSKEQVRWQKVWEFNGSSGLEVVRSPAYSTDGRLSASDMLVTPDTKILFDDWRTTFEFTLTEEAAAQGITTGIQSVTDIAGVPYVLSIKGSVIRLTGPNDLYGFWNTYKQNKDTPLPMEIKLEKEMPQLVAGLYRLSVERDGIRLKFTLSGEPSPVDPFPFGLSSPFTATLPTVPQLHPQSPAPWGPVSLEIQDFNLSSWIMKLSQFVIRKPPGGLLVQSGEVQKKFGGPGGLEVKAVDNFHRGEYQIAAADLGVIAQKGEELNQARAKFYLGLIGEISARGQYDDVIAAYLDAKQTISRYRPARSSPQFAEQAELLKQVHIRLAVCYAKKIDWRHASDRWQAVDEELAQGWMGNSRIGETLGWELQNVLDLVQREPNKEAVIGPALNIFKRSGLDPVSIRVADNARSFGGLLAVKGRFAELRELYNAVPTPALNDVFADAARRALPTLPDEAFKLMTYLPPESSKSPGVNGAKASNLTARAVDLVSFLAKAKRWQDAQVIVVRYPSKDAFIRFFEDLPAEAITPETAGAFYSDCLPKVLAAMPKDEAARVALNRCAEHVGRMLTENARFAELITLHTALRQTHSKPDIRLASFFAEAIEKLSTIGDADSDELALKLLRYASEFVASSNDGISRSASEMARRKAYNGDDASFKTIVRVKEAYPAAHLATFAKQALHDYCQARRYDDAIAYFMLARGKFAAESAGLLPDLIAALEHVESNALDRQLDIIWAAVRDDLKHVEDESAGRQWQLEFGDVLLALANWSGARKNYQALVSAKESDPLIAARAALRLATINLARPEPSGATTIEIENALENPDTPADYQLAAEVLAPTSSIRASDLPAKIKALAAPMISPSEWPLIMGLRARLDGDEATALPSFKQALERAPQERLWSAAVASYLLRTKKVATEKDAAPRKLDPDEAQ